MSGPTTLSAAGPDLEARISPLHRSVSRFLLALKRPFLARRVGRPVLEEIDGVPLIVLPEVLNPVVFRTGAFLARSLAGLAPAGGAAEPRLLDMGTGSGVAAIFGARLGYRTVGVDLNPVAVRCARINALLNGLEHRMEVRYGDLFQPVRGERFDLVLFNPPFFRGRPRSRYDLAWRGTDVMERFAGDLEDALAPGGRCLLLLSTDGDAGAMLRALDAARLAVEVARRRHYGNEILTIYRVARREGG
ncbi:MAG: methyltransferase [Thermoanaerobaculia bacterium]|nr:methyltransferase [Thermoanaerobaculia bacterium]